MNDLNIKPDGPKTEAKRARRISGAEFIHLERCRQIEVKRRTAQYDAVTNHRGQLAAAGLCYSLLAAGQCQYQADNVPDMVSVSAPKQWPWPGAAWKPSNSRLKNLIRAGALLAAEIDRLMAKGEVIPDDEPTDPRQDGAAAGPAE